MNSGRFFLPNMTTQFTPLMRSTYIPKSMGMGFLGRITNSIRRFNWSGLLNGANKTLNVVNQTIPLVRQAGPMISNMKNMLRIARAFGVETTDKNNLVKNKIVNSENSNHNSTIIQKKEEVSNDNYPNFFV